ncbi:MAG TPA: hypothetical protein VGH13_09555 [Xanthobacteraceae bacterium]|jgi:hypothetical protein
MAIIAADISTGAFHIALTGFADEFFMTLKQAIKSTVVRLDYATSIGFKMNKLLVKRPVSVALFVAALTVVGAGSSFSKPLPDEVPQRQSSGAPNSETARDAAVHDCSVEASKWSMNNWQSTQIVVFGGCMTDRGQPQ